MTFGNPPKRFPPKAPTPKKCTGCGRMIQATTEDPIYAVAGVVGGTCHECFTMAFG